MAVMDNDPSMLQRVFAERTGAVRVDGGGPVVAVSGVVLGSITIGGTSYALDDLATTPAPPPRDPVATPSRLLAAQQRTVAFTGRDEELTALAQWRDAPDVPWAIRLLHGPGGEGKTRLALRAAELAAREGWRVVEARHRSSVAPAPAAAPSDRLLLLVDYAERWPAEHLLGLIEAPLVRGHRLVRILLISRQAGAWWQAIRHELGKYTDDVDQLRLTHLAPGPQREAAFAAARDEFARILDVDAGDIRPPANLSGPEFDLVLSVHMAALVAVHTRRTGAGVPDGAAGLSRYLLEREQAAWHALHRRGVIATPPAAMAQAVATATLTRALPVDAAITALATAGVADASGAGPLLDDHGVCYPSGRRGVVLEPLYPDRLAEDLLALTLPGHDAEDFFVPTSVAHWAGKLVETLLGPEAPWLREGLIVVIETAHRWPHVATDHLFPLLRRSPALAVAAGAVALIRLVELPDIDFEVLAGVAQALPDHRDLELDGAAAAVSEHLSRHLLARAPDGATKVVVLAELGMRLANAGQLVRALEAFTRAARLCVRLDERKPGGTHIVSAAIVYSMQGLMLLDLGRAGDALEPLQTAVTRFRALVRGDRQYLPQLAAALSNLALSLARLGHARQAQSTNEEALRIRRRLYRRAPDKYADELATSLSNIGAELLRVRRVAEALPMMLEALQLRRGLARGAPSAHLVEVAISLNNLASVYLALGRREEALESSLEAVEIRRQLVRLNADAFEPELASALTNLAVLQMRHGRPAQACLTTFEAVEVYRRLAQTRPGAHIAHQVGATNQLAELLLRTQRPAQAREAAAEALALTGRLIQIDPSVVRSEQVMATNCLFRALSELGSADEAERVATLLVEQAAAWTPDIGAALSLDVLCGELSDRQFHALALRAADTAVRLFRSAEHRETSAPEFAGALIRLGTELVRAGRPADAQAALREAASLVDQPEPTGRLRLVATRVATLRGVVALGLGELDEAAELAARAAGLARAVALPPNAAGPLVALLEALAPLLTAAGRADDAARLAEDSDAIRNAEPAPDEAEFRLVTL